MISPFVAAAAKGGSFRDANGTVIKRPVITSVTIDGEPIDINRKASAFANGDTVEVVVSIQGCAE